MNTDTKVNQKRPPVFAGNSFQVDNKIQTIFNSFNQDKKIKFQKLKLKADVKNVNIFG